MKDWAAVRVEARTGIGGASEVGKMVWRNSNDKNRAGIEKMEGLILG